MAILKTRRLLLRPLTLEDAPGFYAYAKNSHVGPRAGWKPHESINESEEIIRQMFLGQDGVFAILWQETGELIGTVGLVPDPKRENPAARMIGYSLAESFWGIGIMTEAVRATLSYGFIQLGLELISACCYPDNAASRAILKKCGFEYEGMLHQADLLYNGDLKDIECYYLLA